jgi:hypothetical protein
MISGRFVFKQGVWYRISYRNEYIPGDHHRVYVGIPPDNYGNVYRYHNFSDYSFSDEDFSKYFMVVEDYRENKLKELGI